MASPSQRLQDRVAQLIGKRPIAWHHATGGYTPALRWTVRFADGSTCFVKAGADPGTATWLRQEHRKVYSQVEAPWLPRLIAWEDHDEMPVLLLEDLSDAFWPPPWSSERIDAVLRVLPEVARAPLAQIPTLAEIDKDMFHSHLKTGWDDVARDPGPFLSLGLVSAQWLRSCISMLPEAARSTSLAGTEVLHLDIRSDNLCFSDDRTILIDWNHVCPGSRRRGYRLLATQPPS
jgi:hypothetical protein